MDTESDAAKPNGASPNGRSWTFDPSSEPPERLGDYTINKRVIFISSLALIIGLFASVVALILMRLIGLFTNLFYFGRIDTSLVPPDGNHWGVATILIPVVGGIVVGIMARYGSDKIRGHGIPEATEAILLNGSRIQPRVAVLKPLGSAIAIGTGGPFGAEGPIIVTGGAIGSLIAQFIHLTSSERKTLLVSGAAAGMAATFAAPVSAVILAAELLLFEWKPRSLIPVAVACAAAAGMRPFLIGTGPLFPTIGLPGRLDVWVLLCCVLVGLLGGLLSIILTLGIYKTEELYERLPIHWMWWPAIGGIIVGIGGLIFPQALGVGYGTIGQLVQGDVTTRVIIGVLIVKSVIWTASLSSGTSGGTLAPLLMMGGALGGVEALFLPHVASGFWVTMSMGCVFGATLGSPFAAIVFMLEVTHDPNILLPLLITVMLGHAVLALSLRRSILTERISRRGYHLSREYSVDPLEILFVREVMQTDIIVLPEGTSPADLRQRFDEGERFAQGLYPVVDSAGMLKGVYTSSQLHEYMIHSSDQTEPIIEHLEGMTPAVAYPDEPLRVAVHRMAATGLTRFPVVTHDNPPQLVGMLSLSSVLRARARNLEAERRREQILPMRMFLPFGSQQVKQTEISHKN
ncbi:MAG TPA: chloride channel protein [Nitrolancea sp.]|nr:chloride channel protein [Nitrolancea sp.]